jgi:hypothetical protein
MIRRAFSPLLWRVQPKGTSRVVLPPYDGSLLMGPVHNNFTALMGSQRVAYSFCNDNNNKKKPEEDKDKKSTEGKD